AEDWTHQSIPGQGWCSKTMRDRPRMTLVTGVCLSLRVASSRQIGGVFGTEPISREGPRD
ncbi:MAG: hypothetical protein ACXADO_09720, partial [Candidatus Thorarchaeota archaeon]